MGGRSRDGAGQVLLILTKENMSRLWEVKETQRIWTYGAAYQEGVWMIIIGSQTDSACYLPHARESGGATATQKYPSHAGFSDLSPPLSLACSFCVHGCRRAATPLGHHSHISFIQGEG